MPFQPLFTNPDKKDIKENYASKFKYTTKFQAQANFLSPASPIKEALEAKASLDELKSMLPDDKDFLEENDDLVFTAFNLFTANLANKNGDCVLKDDAIKIAKGFVHRFANLEHNRWDIVGHGIDYGFHSFTENEPLTEEALAKVSEFDPFNVSLAAIIYKLADPYFADFVQEEASDPNSPYFNSVSASFEVGFNYAWIAVGSPNMKDATIIEDQEQVEELTPMLASEGGTGYNKEGQPIYRIVKEPKALGFGYVQFPAGSVRGLVTANNNTEGTTININFEEKINELTQKVSKIEAKAQKETNKHNKELKNSVNKPQVISKIMIKSINDIQQDQMTEIKASDVRELFRDGVKDAVDNANSEWEQKLEAEKTAKADIEKAKSDLEDALATQKDEFAKVKENFEKVTKELVALKEAQALAKKEQDFQSRMAIIDDEYNLSAEARATLAKTIKNLGDDSEFNEWKTSFDTVAGLQKKSDQDSKETQASNSLKDISTNIDKNSAPGNSLSDELKSDDFMNKLKESFSTGEKGGVSLAKRLF